MKKKSLAIILCAVMIAALLPGQAFAATKSTSQSKWATAYLKVLKKNKTAIQNSEGSSSVASDLNFSVAFADVTGDGIPEMFYTVNDGGFQTSCKVASFNGKKVKHLKIKDSGGYIRDSLFISGAPNGARNVLFTVKGSRNLFVKSGTIAGFSFDGISEYKYSKGYLVVKNHWEIGHNVAGENYISINGKAASAAKVKSALKAKSKKIKNVLLGSFCFYLSEFPNRGKTIAAKKECARTYTQAVKYLKKKQ